MITQCSKISLAYPAYHVALTANKSFRWNHNRVSEIHSCGKSLRVCETQWEISICKRSENLETHTQMDALTQSERLNKR